MGGLVAETSLRRFWRIILALCLVGCGHPEREACYAAAETSAANDAFKECPGKWSDCPHRAAIMAELTRSERACK